MLQEADVLADWRWEPQPEAGALIGEIVTDFLKRHEDARECAARLHAEAAVRFADLIDTIVLPSRSVLLERAERAGWTRQGSVWRNPAGRFPRITARDTESVGIQLKVESAADFRAANGVLRSLGAIARHRDEDPRVIEAFRSRPREFANDEEGFRQTARVIDIAIAAAGHDRAVEMFFAAEREYWQSRNRAAQVQKARQDRLGIGWANHDHHTYRSSRVNFAPMIALFERFGFYCRERFYAGLAAGWGAQVLEHDETGIVLFCDVDLSPEELRGDFAHDGLAPREELGTIGLWCALHGDSILQAGMHHLECTFDFDALREQLARDAIGMMKPFSNFAHLKQSFTEGERWRVDPIRLQRLVDRGAISQDQARQFESEGAIGSHLENLERNNGFKGFNQAGVNEIIAATNPLISRQT